MQGRIFDEFIKKHRFPECVIKAGFFDKHNLFFLLNSVVSHQQKPALFHPASFQSVPSTTEVVTIKDENGIPRAYPVDTPTYDFVRSIVTGRAAIGGNMQASNIAIPGSAQHQVNLSMGSLPSSASVHSSQSSITSQTSQASSFSTTPGRYLK